MARGAHGHWNEIFTNTQHSWGLEGRLWRGWGNGSALGAPSLHLEKPPCPGKVLPGPPAPEAAEPKAPALQLCPPQPSLPPSDLSKARSRFWNTQRSHWGLFPIHLWPLPRASPGEHTHHTHTDTQSLYTRDIPRKKHLIHPLNNSDNSVLSPIYMFQTRYRCYENIANIQKYIHLKTKQTPYKLLTIAIR